jgi:hypothetical protein
MLTLLGMPGYKATEAIAKDLEAKGFTVRTHKITNTSLHYLYF